MRLLVVVVRLVENVVLVLNVVVVERLVLKVLVVLKVVVNVVVVERLVENVVVVVLIEVLSSDNRPDAIYFNLILLRGIAFPLNRENVTGHPLPILHPLSQRS